MTMTYTAQEFANLLAFLTHTQYTPKLTVLKKIHHLFEENHIKWALACSSPLFFLGIQDDFHDFDVLVAPDDAEKVDKLLQTIGEKTNPELTPAKTNYFDDDYFGKFKVDTVQIDVISEFGFTTFGTKYKYHFSPKQIDKIRICRDLVVPSIPLEAQFIFYGMMIEWEPQRRFKMELIENYLKENGLNFPEVFEEALCDYSLPDWMKVEICELLKNP